MFPTFASTGTIKAAYCNDKYLVIHSAGDPSPQTSGLLNIPKPPGSDSGCLLRSYVGQSQTYKIPLAFKAYGNGSQASAFPSGVVMSAGQNDLPMSGAIGVALNGVPTFPVQNNRNIYSWESCELDKCSAHAGKGGDYHYVRSALRRLFRR